MERQADNRGCGRRHSESDYSQAYGRAGAFGRGMCVSDPLSADASGICTEHRNERTRARKGNLPDDHEREALAAAISNSGAGKRATQPGCLILGALRGRKSAIDALQVDVCSGHRVDLQNLTAALVLNLPHNGLGGGIAKLGKPDLRLI